jgi:hypothetical protein
MSEVDWSKPIIFKADGKQYDAVYVIDTLAYGEVVKLILVIKSDTHQDIIRVDENGCRTFGTQEQMIFNRFIKKHGWINIYKRRYESATIIADCAYVYKTKALADAAVGNNDRRVACVKIEWEE